MNNDIKPQPKNKFIYQFLKFFVSVVYRFYFKTYIINKHYADTNKPTLLIANHSNSIVDSILILISLKRSLYYVVRGDVFVGWKKKLFSYFNMIPIFRKEEGLEFQHKNIDSFKQIYNTLNKNKIVLIFSEGICIQEKKLQPFRKGTAKIVIEFDQLINIKGHPLQIVPVALNYENWNKVKSNVVIEYGAPITLNEIDFSACKNDNEKSKLITSVLEEKLKEHLLEQKTIFNTIDFEVYDLINNNLELNNIKSYEIRKKIHESFNNFTKEQTTLLLSKVNIYKEYLKESGLIFFCDNRLSKLNLYLQLFLIIISSTFLIVGLLFHYPAWYFAKRRIETKVKKIEFKMSVRVTLSFIIWFIQYIIFTILFFILFGFISSLIIMSLIFVCGILSYQIHNKLLYLLQILKIKNIKNNNTAMYSKLYMTYKDLKNFIYKEILHNSI